jgi:hypothetical protein
VEPFARAPGRLRPTHKGFACNRSTRVHSTRCTRVTCHPLKRDIRVRKRSSSSAKKQADLGHGLERHTCENQNK